MKRLLKKLFAAFIILPLAFFAYFVFAQNYVISKSNAVQIPSLREDLETKIGYLRKRQILPENVNPVYLKTLEPGTYRLVEYSLPMAAFVIVFDLQDRSIFLIETGT